MRSAAISLKSALGYDDSLDVFGVHCIGGIIGALGTGLLVSPHLGYVSRPGEAVATYVMSTQMVAQCKAVLLTLVWSGFGSAIIYLVLDLTIGLRPKYENERVGLDLTEHGERAYNDL